MAWINKKGFNFRDTAIFDTDGTNEIAIVGDGGGNIAAASVYPRSVTIDGDTFNVGWSTSNGDGARNRSAANDARMAGQHMVQNNVAGGRVFRIDLPAPGTYEITLAVGDQGDGAHRDYWEILDDSSSLEIVDKTATAMTANHWWDTSGTKHTSAVNWIASQVPKNYVFASQICNVRIGAGSAATTYTTLGHIGIRSIPGVSTGAAMIHHLRNLGAY